MFNLYEILRNAQGGQAIDNLAAQFNITPEEADAAVKAIVPELSEGLLKQTSQPVGFGSFLGALGESQHKAAFADPAAAQDTATAQRGNDLLSQILSSSHAREEIALRASSASGVNSDVLSQMLPVIVSMIFGGLNKSMQDQGFGGILGQLANAAGKGGFGPVLDQILGGGQAPANPRTQAPAPGGTAGPGGLGSILEQILAGSQAPAAPPPAPAPAGGQGGMGAILGSILGSLLGRPGSGQATQPAPQKDSPQMPGFDPATIQASLEALTKILQPGTTSPAAPPQAQPGGLHSEISDIMTGKHH